MTEDDIKQVLTSPAVVEFFERRLNDRRRLMSAAELSRQVNTRKEVIKHAMDVWESSRGAYGLAFIRFSDEGGHRFTCMSAYEDWIRREEQASARRAVMAYKGSRYSA